MRKIYICERCNSKFERTTNFKEGKRILCSGCAISEAHKKRFADPVLKERFLKRTRETNIEKYGKPNVASVEEFKKKQISTQIKKYGYCGYFQKGDPKEMKEVQTKAHSPSAYSKKEKTCKNKYGVSHHMKTEESKQKVSNTYFLKTGYHNPAQNPEAQAKGYRKGYLFEGEIFDSGWELAFYIWLRDNNKKFIYHPNFTFDYVGDDKKQHVYKPDFLIEGVFYEIKGDQFFNEKGEPFNQYTNTFWWNKYNKLVENKVQILTFENMKEYLRYVKDLYGKNYIKQFKQIENKVQRPSNSYLK